MATSILIPLFNPKTCFTWLGSCTVLSRLLRKLNDVRDIESIRIVTDNPQVRTLLGSWPDDPEHFVDVMPSVPADLLELCKSYLRDDRTFVVCNPLFPFVSEETINKVLFAVQSSPSVVTTSDGFGVVEEKGVAKLQPICIVHPACLAVQPQSQLLQPGSNPECLAIGEHVSVSLTAIEVLSLESSEGLDAAKILSTYYA